MKLYQLTKFNVQSETFKRVADKAVAAGMTWQEVCKHMADSTDANVDYALEALRAVKRYTFHNSSGELCEVRPHLDTVTE